MTPREGGVTDGCRPEGNRAEVEIVSTSELLPGNVVWGEDGWYAVLDSDQNDSTQVSAAQIIDDAGGQDEDSILYGEWFLRLAHPAATAREEAFYEAALAYFESDKARMAAFTGEVFIEGPESAAIAEAGKRLGAARAAYAALALTRSVKGTEA